MDLLQELSPETRALVDLAARLSRECFAPRAARYDATATFPFENYADLRRHGFLGLMVPREYGGLGADSLTYSLVLHQIAKGCAATGLTFNMHSAILAFLQQLATPEQRDRYFREAARDGKVFASITSEPGSSFRDKFAVGTLIKRADGGYVINGTKHFCSLATGADYYFTWGVLEGVSDSREGLLTLLVPRDTPGITLEETWDALGMRGTASHTLHYRDCFVPASQVVGAPGAILGQDMSLWSLGYTAVYLGIAEAAYDFAVHFAATQKFKPAMTPIMEHPNVQQTIGQMHTTLEAARHLLYEAARVRAAGDRRAKTLAMNRAKYAASEAGVAITQLALRLCGGRGILKSFPLERHLRDAMAGPVMPPSNDRCLETIGKLVLGLEAATLEFS
jgi:alkylation response protein AidB-like acyl-CoA dehydrogenase